MKEKLQFGKCNICGNVVELLDGDIKNITCCGEKIDLIKANTVDASIEKHVPVYEKNGDNIIVKVGSIEHPMEEEHYIEWIMLVSEDIIIKVKLHPFKSTETKLPYIKNSIIYSYCNKHGLWQTTVE